MQHRIRAAALIVQDDKILMVEHKHPKSGRSWWVPPGGGLEHGESLFECARREVWEETGLSVDLGEIVYVREFVDLELQRHNLEVFILASGFSGSLSLANVKGPDAAYIKKAYFLSREEMKDTTVFPEILKDSFWDDLEKGFPVISYLGLQEA